MDFHDFKAIKKQYCPSLIWNWCGCPNAEELDDALKRFAALGIKAVTVRPLAQLSLPYLGDDYYELIRTAARRCAKYNIELWISDENAPASGSGGGEITSVPDYCAHSLSLIPDGELSKSDKVLCADGGKSVIVECKTGKQYADIGNEQVGQCFSETVYGGYRHNCARFVGNEICGMVSEPAFVGEIPYNAAVYAQFEAESGKSALALFKEGEEGEKARSSYLSMLGRAANKNFVSVLSDTCRESGMHFSINTAESLFECAEIYSACDAPYVTFDVSLPDFTQVKRHTSLCDILHKTADVKIQIPNMGKAIERKQATALSAALGAHTVCYDSVPFSLADRQKYEPHRFVFCADGEKTVSDYASRVLRIVNETDYCPNICLIYPDEYMRGLMQKDRTRAYAAFEEVTKKLLYSGVDFHIADESTLKTHGSITANALKIGEYEYKSVLLTETVCLEGLCNEIPSYFVKAADFIPQTNRLSVNATTDVLLSHRKNGGREYTFAYFASGGETELTYSGENQLFIADALNGELYAAPCENGTLRLKVQGGSTLIFVTGENIYADPMPPVVDGAVLCGYKTAARLGAELAMCGENVLPLKKVNACFGKKSSHNENLDNLRDRFYSLPDGETVKLKYPFEVKLAAIENAHAYIEYADNMEQILLNGTVLRLHSKGSGFFEADISDILADGKNTFSLEYKKASKYLPEEGKLPPHIIPTYSPTGLEPIYIAGDFDTDGTEIVPCKLEGKDVASSGMTHYYGKLTYALKLGEIPPDALLKIDGSFDSLTVQIGKRIGTFFNSPAVMELFELDSDITCEITITNTPHNLFRKTNMPEIPFGITAAELLVKE